MKKSRYSPELKARCISKYRSGERIINISKELNVPRSTLYYWINKYGDITNSNDISYTVNLERLRKQNERMEQICEILKSVACTCNAPLKTRLVELEKLYGRYSVRVLCDALDVDRGTFYNHILRNKKGNTIYAERRAILSEAIRKVHEESHGLFGSDKILSVLQTQGYKTSKKMVRELMKEMGLRSLRSRAKKDYALWNKLHEHNNVLMQDFKVDAPDLVWVSDCTQFVIFKKTYYLCAILDLFSRKVISYKISSKASTQLVTATFNKAYARRAPSPCLVLHSDRGCQYTSYAFRKLLISNNVTQSFSRGGNPYDNGVMESFFSSLKQEEIYRTSYRSIADCKSHIEKYMQFYNTSRPHRANNWKSPDQIEEIYYNKKENRVVQ